MERTFIEDLGSVIGSEVIIKCFVHVRRDQGKLVFLDLRDMTGLVQGVILPGAADAHAIASDIRSEWILAVRAMVNKRPEKNVNPNIQNGDLELEIREIEVLARSETPPMPLDSDGLEIDESLRMKYRYLDLRRSRLLKNLQKRSALISGISQFLKERRFVEVETPILSKSTPEGARDYLVPVRLHRGTFYALPQSPQQYKQLLMVAGLERYFQIARCFRDEDTRGDRQPEFTQIDLEMSFVEREDVLSLLESMMCDVIPKLYPEKKISNKPFPRFSYKEAIERFGTDRPDVREDKNDPNELAFCWVLDFPFYEWNDNENKWDFGHNPFSMPLGEKLPENPEDLGAVMAAQYDLALNGLEIAGGSIRNHKPDLLKKAFTLLGYKAEEVQEKFGHMMEAFKFGVPPHGGFAIGFDRLVMILANEPNIREVIAFPKTGDGRDLMMTSPTEASREQLQELGLHIERSA